MAKKKHFVGETISGIMYHIAYVKDRSSRQIVDVMDPRQQLILGHGGAVFKLHRGPAAPGPGMSWDVM